MIKFACIAPHPPMMLPNVGSESDRQLVSKTISSLQLLNKKIATVTPDTIVISSPHPDWGFKVPLYFLAPNLTAKLDTFLTQEDSPLDHFNIGKDLYFSELKNNKGKIALVASGDLSHRLKTDGLYRLHPDGTRFDQALIQALLNNDIETILNLDNIYPEAGECGLRSFCFILGILQASHIKWKAQILSYEAPFGVGYLIADLMNKDVAK